MLLLGIQGAVQCMEIPVDGGHKGDLQMTMSLPHESGGGKVQHRQHKAHTEWRSPGIVYMTAPTSVVPSAPP